jgi:apolipoprotein N-acyltransferase
MSAAPAVLNTEAWTRSRALKPKSSPAAAFACACLSGLLLYLAFPPAEQSWLVYIALVPLLTLVNSPLSRGVVYPAAWTGGLVFWLASLVWMWELHPSAWLAWLALAIYQSLYWPLFLAFARVLTRAFRTPMVLAVPAAWVACEYIQNHALSGFPWYYLAHAAYRALPLIQISDLTGAFGVSFVIAMVNACAALCLERPWRGGEWRSGRVRLGFILQIVTTVLVVGLTLAYGVTRIAHSSFVPGPRILLLQSNFRQVLKNSLEPDRILGVYRSLIEDGFRRDDLQARPIDLTVWPETSYPYGFSRIAEGLTPSHIDAAGKTLIPSSSAADWYSRRKLANDQLSTWSETIGGPMLVGSTLFDFDEQGARRANAAVWFDSRRAAPEIYCKMHLVPFGEYVPFYNIAPWVARLAPYDEYHLPRLVPGSGPSWFDDGRFTYAPLICFEDTLPHVARRFFQKPPRQRQPDVLVNISNDGWFNGSAEHDMHLAIGVFRAVENRAPLVRAANMGYSASIDGNGQIRSVLKKSTEGSLVADVMLDPREAPYSRWGDIFSQICLFFVVFLNLTHLARLIFPKHAENLQHTKTA